ncbi:unnamed protein product, partial [Allacma fusca]
MEINCENSTHESVDVSDTFTAGSSSSSKNNTKSFRSSIHQHYKLLDYKSKFKCNYCGKVLKRDSTGSTSSLRKHVARSHKSVTLKGDQEAKTSQLSIDNFLVMDSRDKFDQHRFEKLLVEFVIDSNQPFSIVNSSAFCKFSEYWRAEARLPKNDKMKSLCMKRFEQERTLVEEKLR